MGLAEVSTILWRERELLELLLFKLEEEQLLLAAGRTRWLARSTREVEVVLGEIRRTELTRATEVDDVAAALGLGPGPSLTMLANACPEPWAGLLRDHQNAFRVLTSEITQLSALNHDLLTTGQQATRDALLHLTGGGRTYTPNGTSATVVTRPMLMDEVL
jgi:FlgN protein